MANELYRYTNPDSATVSLTFDSGQVVYGTPVVHEGRSDCKRLAVPLDATGGAVLTVAAPGYQTFSNRARFMPNPDGPATLDVDDITLVPIAETPPEPEPPETCTSPDPLTRINYVYSHGTYDLGTKTGCGTFTEAVALDFARFYFDRQQRWGHIQKTGAQNQYNGHAVDAIQNLYGEHNGKWDIIVSSVSANAHPAFNEAGEANPDDFLPVSAVKPQKT